jgi:hypothetical protein
MRFWPHAKGALLAGSGMELLKVATGVMITRGEVTNSLVVIQGQRVLYALRLC